MKGNIEKIRLEITFLIHLVLAILCLFSLTMGIINYSLDVTLYLSNN